VATRTVSAGDVSAAFPLAEFSQFRLLNGLDDIDVTLTHEPEIGAFERDRPAYLPAVV
jgi:3-isopropylmalate/(R)-2-methylmalate dehydratase small subunit